jgi:hypothetical protein
LARLLIIISVVDEKSNYCEKTASRNRNFNFYIHTDCEVKLKLSKIATQVPVIK